MDIASLLEYVTHKESSFIVLFFYASPLHVAMWVRVPCRQDGHNKWLFTRMFELNRTYESFLWLPGGRRHISGKSFYGQTVTATRTPTATHASWVCTHTSLLWIRGRDGPISYFEICCLLWSQRKCWCASEMARLRVFWGTRTAKKTMAYGLLFFHGEGCVELQRKAEQKTCHWQDNKNNCATECVHEGVSFPPSWGTVGNDIAHQHLITSDASSSGNSYF